eukprot:UN00352
MADDYSQYADQGGQWDGADETFKTTAPAVTAAPAEGEKTFEDVYRTAFMYYANIIKAQRDPDHEFVENPDLIEMPGGQDCEDFLYRIGQKDVTTTFPEFVNESYTCNEIYDFICDFGIDSKPDTVQFNALFSTLHLLNSLSQAFLSKDARSTNPNDMTNILLGQVTNEKSSIKTAFTPPQMQTAKDKAFFDANKETFFTAECTIELVNTQSKQWCKDILTNAVNVLSITARQFFQNSFSIQFEDPSDTLLTVKFLQNTTNKVMRDNVVLFLNELTKNVLPYGFSTHWKWAIDFDEIFTVPLTQLLQTQVSLSLPTVGIKKDLFGLIKTAPIPYDQFGVTNFDELCTKIPGLDDIVNQNNLTTTLDLREFVQQTLTTVLSKFAEQVSGDIKQLCLLDLVAAFSPMIFNLITPFLNGLKLEDCLSALKSVVALARLIFARDFNNFTNLNAKCSSGHSLEFDANNVFKIDSFFRAIDSLLGKLEQQIQNQAQ